MKNISYLKILGIFMISMAILTSCSSDDNNGNPPADSSLLTGKWWYDTDNFAADIYFHTDGMYEQKLEFLGTEFVSSGEWSWQDESTGILLIENLSGNGQLLPELFIKVTDLLESTMTVQQSSDGIDYSFEVYYSTTDND